MYCRKCGAAIGDDDLFCTDCGADANTTSNKNQVENTKVEVSAAEPATHHEQIDRVKPPVIKAGTERIWGKVLIGIAILGTVTTAIWQMLAMIDGEYFQILRPRGWVHELIDYLFYINHDTMNFTELVAHFRILRFLGDIVENTWTPLVLLIVGICGLRLLKGLGQAKLDGKRLSIFAIPDITAGVTLVLLNPVCLLLSFVIQVFIAAFGSSFDILDILLIGSVSVLSLIMVAIIYFRASSTARSIGGFSPMYSAPTIALCLLAVLYILAYLLPIFAGFFAKTIAEYNVIVAINNTISALAFGAFFVIRGVFWSNAAERLSHAAADGQIIQISTNMDNSRRHDSMTQSVNNGRTGATVQPIGSHGAPPVTAELTGGSKFGYFALGFFLGVVGVLIAWLTNKDKPIEKPAIKMSVIGLVVSYGLLCTCSCVIFALPLAMSAF